MSGAAAMAVAALCGALAAFELTPHGHPRPLRARRRPLLSPVLRDLGRRLGARGAAAGTAARLEAAGVAAEPADVAAMRLGGIAMATLAVLPLILALPARSAVAVAAAAAGAAALAPDVVIARRTRVRAAVMGGELADVLDLLRVAFEAGLPVRRALGEVAGRHRGALAGELGRLDREMALGQPLQDSLDALRRRVPLAAAGPLVAALSRAARHGASPSPVLRSLAEDARADAARAVAEHAARAAPRVQLVVALLLVPAAMLLVAAAMLPAVG